MTPTESDAHDTSHMRHIVLSVCTRWLPSCGHLNPIPLQSLSAHLLLYVGGGVHQVPDDAHCLIVDARILSLQHLDQHRQRALAHNKVLVVLILESQGAQGARCRTLHLQ